jgi:NAD(P)H-flavin reductase/hemoglobin-like flavoprotein
VGLDDRDALLALRGALDPSTSPDGLVLDFYMRWFAADPSVRALFGPELSHQRQAFARVVHWLIGEIVDQRAEQPVAFLAQLGRDHRKYGVAQAHYDTLSTALLTALRAHFGDSWDGRLAEAARDVVELTAGIMRGAADADKGPPYRDATVVDHIRATRDVSIIRLHTDSPMYYYPGQYVSVAVPQWPTCWRYLSPSIPADRGGDVEFHVRSVPGGMVSTAIVNETRVGDRWRLASPHGSLHVDREGDDILMVAGSSGLAPLRTIVMDLSRFAENPRVHVFFGGRYPCDLYDLHVLWQIASTNPWLSVTPVSEFATDPPWAADHPVEMPPRGLHVRQTGVLADVVTRYGSWGDRQILISGGPEMIATTKAALVAKGADPQRIQHDPLFT